MDFQVALSHYLATFVELARKYDQTPRHCSELEQVIDDYSKFVTNADNKLAWERMAPESSRALNPIVVELRKLSSLCVAIMEKYRALKLQSGAIETADYFRNIEACIDKEFGSFQITSDSKLLLIGSGSFPMTPLLIAKRTGAEVVGIDIDEEAIALGLMVVEKLGAGLNIRLEQTRVEELDIVRDLTHIIFSSTVAQKYDLLEQLYPLTNKDIVVSMRYGDGLKSLFNYPMREVGSRTWSLVDNILRPHDLFDIALYKKAAI
ncbi:hypothetical protein GCM10010912_04340 [Paenibacillus albidus]|uniref:Uncharacterized protein n=1 Tax=Paenibacillus albidus TaxID=2041023 RepID=A0A917BZ72_9BACL|nr:class I SAM-dependent methyltransferase [Paenibacillus albidus]GGF62331.1 hypothetical protein GCM10010912_04340 [Paenibacillus albidus]